MSKRNQTVDRFQPADSQFQYEMYPFYWVARLNNQYTQLMERKLKPLGLTVTGWRVCLILRQNGRQSMSEISAHSAVKLSTVTRAVYALRDEGLTKVEPRANDARVSEVEITPKGLALIDRAVQDTAPIIQRTFSDMPEKNIEQLNKLLAEMFSHLSAA